MKVKHVYNPLSGEMDLINTEESKTNVPKFEEIVDHLEFEVTSGSPATDPGEVVFLATDKIFVWRTERGYFRNWATVLDYMTSWDGTPIKHRLFECNGQYYVFDGESLVHSTVNIGGSGIELVHGLGDSTEKAMSQAAVTNLYNQGYKLVGTATPSTTPITLTGDEKVFYIATEEGDYTNFGLGNISELSTIKSVLGSWSVEGLGTPLNVGKKVKTYQGVIGSSGYFYTKFTPPAVNKIYKIKITGTNIDSSSNVKIEPSSTSNLDLGRYYFNDETYIPIFSPCGLSITVVGTIDTNVNIDVFELAFANFNTGNNLSIFNYQKITGAMDLSLRQGYSIGYEIYDNATYWVTTPMQYNRGRKIKVSVPAGYTARIRYTDPYLETWRDGATIPNGTIIDTSNMLPWAIQFLKNYKPITPEVATSEGCKVEDMGGDLFSMPLPYIGAGALIKNATAETTKRIERLESTAHRNPLLGQLEMGKIYHHLNVEKVGSVIPSQSLFDIAYAKALGMKIIEFNLQTCSDGVVVCKHGNASKLGAGLIFKEGSSLTQDTLFSDVTSTQLRSDVTYDSPYMKYRGFIPTLTEVCKECAKLGMIAYLRGCSDSMLAEARKYLTDDMIIVEGPNQRGDFKGLMMQWATNTDITHILTICEKYKAPFLYGLFSLPDNIEEISQALHEKGYLIGLCYANQNLYQNALVRGFDLFASTYLHIPSFDIGNKISITKGSDSKLVLNNVTYDNANDILEMPANATIVVNDSEIGASMSKVCIKLRYSGNITVIVDGKPNNYYNNLNNFTSDGNSEIAISVASEIVGAEIIKIIANEYTEIYDMKIFASII